MRSNSFVSIISALIIGATSALAAPAAAETVWPTDKQCAKLENPSEEVQGWCLAINRTKGNCLGCHTISVTPWPEGFPEAGNIAPPLVAMKARFPDTEKLRMQIYDATQTNPHSVMPPFGKNGALTDTEIDKIVTFLQSI